MSLATPDTHLHKRWTVPDYHRLAELGLLAPDERTELLAGYITLMAPKGTLHVTALHLLAQQLRECLPAATIRTQDPIQLDDRSEPEPDLAIARGNVLDYLECHPRPADLLLVVEVADTTLPQDCGLKAQLYAQAGLADYWVLDVQNRQLRVFRDPSASGYEQQLILAESQRIAPLAFADLELAIAALLPPNLPSN